MKKLFLIGLAMVIGGFAGLALTRDGIFTVGVFGMILIILSGVLDSAEKGGKKVCLKNTKQ